LGTSSFSRESICAFGARIALIRVAVIYSVDRARMAGRSAWVLLYSATLARVAAALRVCSSVEDNLPQLGNTGLAISNERSVLPLENVSTLRNLGINKAALASYGGVIPNLNEFVIHEEGKGFSVIGQEGVIKVNCAFPDKVPFSRKYR